MGSVFFALLLAAMTALNAQAQVITQTSTVQGVTVAATAGNLGAQTTVWDFAVVLDSAGQLLGDDLTRSAVLVDSHGHEQPALVWEGAGSDGTHRAGVLKFFAVSPRPDWVELRITRPGEARPRTFSWLLGSGLVARAQPSGLVLAQ
jgi:hypothetical protein